MENQDTRVLFDASAYVLIEATGDSDAQHLESQRSDAAAAPTEAAVEEDAQSCSRSGRSPLWEEEDLRRVDVDDDRGFVEEEDGGGGSDLEDGVVDQCRPAARSRSKGCEGSGAKMMTEGEGDKLFWEACLASL